MEKMYKMINNRKGFTLIELIVVIAIIGILAAVAIPRIAGATTNARNRANEANIAILTNAASVAVAEHGDPDADVTWTGLTTGTAPHLASSFLQTWPTPPDGFNRYVVTIDDDGTVEVNQPTTP